MHCWPAVENCSENIDRQMVTFDTCQTPLTIVNIRYSFHWRKETMNLPLELSMEQQFNLRMYEGQVKDLSSEQAQNFLLEVMRQLMIKENVIKHLMKGSINI